MTARAGHHVFGKRRTQHVIILASGDKIRHMTVRPWMAALAFCFCGVMAIGYLGATTYLVMRDNLIGASMARQARMQHVYEDRIAALRAQVDRVTSRQLLDQQVVEEKVEKLLEQQMALSSRHGRLGALLDRAEQSGLDTEAPVPSPRPANGTRQASLTGGIKAIESLLGKPAAEPQGTEVAALGYAPAGESVADRTDRIFSRVTISLKDIEQEQFDRIRDLTHGAVETADKIETILARNGVTVQTETPAVAADAIGGPYLAPQPATSFEASLNGLDTALARLETARETATDLPFGNPAPGRDITSGFGNRRDPFLGRPALHAGIDFRSPVGGEIRASGRGKVITAGPVGGYGNMVEIDHGMGFTTRYGHMSRILVKVGDEIAPGEVIGQSGSTGRSTGPHLHYEVRRNGAPIDPMHFVNAGLKLSTLID